MNIKGFTITCLLAVSVVAECQSGTEINITDASGMKQGHWIKKYPNGLIQYEGVFRDDHPVGEFRRYYENSKLKSLMVYSNDGTVVDATVYHPNGFIASKGKYVNQLKEGQWKFYSSEIEGYLINEEEYVGNMRNGPSVKYYPDGTIAEKLSYVNDRREGEWLKYFENGRMFVRSFYSGNLLNGKFEVWFQNGRIQFSGTYKNNRRDSIWLTYNQDGSLLYRIEYTDGYTKDKQMEIDQTLFFEELEKNADKIADPEKTGDIR